MMHPGFSGEETERLVALIAQPDFRLAERLIAWKAQSLTDQAMVAETDEKTVRLKWTVAGVKEVTSAFKAVWDAHHRAAAAREALERPPEKLTAFP